MDWLTQQMGDNNVKIDALSKETNYLKLSIEKSQGITDNKFKKIKSNMRTDRRHVKKHDSRKTRN